MRKLLIAALAVLALGAFSVAPAFAGTPGGGKSNDNGNDTSGTAGNQGRGDGASNGGAGNAGGRES